MNYLFPLLPAPGADDDCSGTVSILEAFRVLAESGFVPTNGPVEFHWYAAEEGGLLGSQAVARYKKESGAKIGAMMEFVSTCISGSTWPRSRILILRLGYDRLHRKECYRNHWIHRDRGGCAFDEVGGGFG